VLQVLARHSELEIYSMSPSESGAMSEHWLESSTGLIFAHHGFAALAVATCRTGSILSWFVLVPFLQQC